MPLPSSYPLLLLLLSPLSSFALLPLPPSMLLPTLLLAGLPSPALPSPRTSLCGGSLDLRTYIFMNKVMMGALGIMMALRW